MNRKPRESGWRYYLPEDQETADDAGPICVWSWQTICDAEDAARLASEDEWSNRDGWESGMGATPLIAVIAPDGTESRWRASREASVEHRVEAIEEEGE